MSARNAIIFRIQNDNYDQWFYNFPKNGFETAEFWCNIALAANVHLLQRI